MRAAARFCLAACTLTPALVSAQGACRAPTDAERAAIERSQQVVRQVFEDGLKNSPWEVGDWSSAEAVARNPQLREPFEFCNDFLAVKLTLRKDSDQAHVLDSIAASAQQAMQTDTGAALAKDGAAMFDAAAAQTVTVRVNMNDPYLFSPRPGKPTEVYAVAGVPFATREITRQSDGTTQAVVDVYLGDFAKARQHIASRDYVPYPFRHAKGTYFENVAIVLTSAPRSVDDVARRIDWSKMAAALSP